MLANACDISSFPERVNFDATWRGIAITFTSKIVQDENICGEHGETEANNSQKKRGILISNFRLHGTPMVFFNIDVYTAPRDIGRMHCAAFMPCLSSPKHSQLFPHLVLQLERQEGNGLTPEIQCDLPHAH